VKNIARNLLKSNFLGSRKHENDLKYCCTTFSIKTKPN
jgi:hypothetical protein